MSMFDELSPIYLQIVGEALTVAPSDWERLWLDCACDTGVCSVGGYFERSGTDVVSFVNLPSTAGDLVYKAWEVSCSYNDRWTSAVFRVARPDKLHITFGHGDLDDDGSVKIVDREDSFRSRIFGTRPVVDVGFDWSGAVTLRTEMLESGSLFKS